MPRAKPPPESHANGAENGSDPPTTMGRFRRLAKGVVAVTREELAEEEQNYRHSRKTGRRAPP
jgi:hypothetical protein